MSLDTNDEILQDFLVEADEIMEGLSEQLVELETNPEDSDLLNAIFRGFHTIKGGAGFLSLDNMVSICHKGEDVFNILRQGERVVDAAMMDTFLQVIDTLTSMFEEVRSGEYPSPAEQEIFDQLIVYISGDATDATDATDEITEDEFENLLTELHGDKAPTGSAVSNQKVDNEDITEEEFEHLLDE